MRVLVLPRIEYYEPQAVHWRTAHVSQRFPLFMLKFSLSADLRHELCCCHSCIIVRHHHSTHPNTLSSMQSMWMYLNLYSKVLLLRPLDTLRLHYNAVVAVQTPLEKTCVITEGFICTLRLQYNAVQYNADSIITRSPRGSQIFFQYKCVKLSADDRGIHNASCENRTPCVFPSQVWHQLIFPWGSVNGSLNNAYVMGDHV